MAEPEGAHLLVMREHVAEHDIRLVRQLLQTHARWCALDVLRLMHLDECELVGRELSRERSLYI